LVWLPAACLPLSSLVRAYRPGSETPATPAVEPVYRCGAKPVTQEECNNGKWDNKWSMTIFARKVSNGEAVWAYQMTPFDQWDYDGINENMLTGMTIKSSDQLSRSLLSFARSILPESIRLNTWSLENTRPREVRSNGSHSARAPRHVGSIHFQ
jgi:hypothetical protein